ncbi:MAG: low molecular weight protein-tyrosine-phosphatase [Polyangiales bacterium]
MSEPKVSLCFVCLGNICRSPTAEGVMKQLARDAGVADVLFIDSAGTGAYHAGERADPRSRAEALRRGVELTSIARQFTPEDFDAFDYVLAMDRANRHDLASMARGASHMRKLHMLRSFEPGAGADLDVPDPYQGGPAGFAHVFDMCVAACGGLLAHVRTTHRL